MFKSQSPKNSTNRKTLETRKDCKKAQLHRKMTNTVNLEQNRIRIKRKKLTRERQREAQIFIYTREAGMTEDR